MYFKNFPNIDYTFPDGTVRSFKNISIRPGIIDKYYEESSNLQEYQIKDGDTPETVAYNIFGEVNYHWIIMLTNNIMNIYTDWPMSTKQFDEYLYEKYKNQPDSDGTIIELTREETLEFVDFKGNPSENYQIFNERGVKLRPHHFIDENKNVYQYDTVIGNTYDAFGRLVVIPTVSPVSISEYENTLNEEKRDIILPKPSIANKINIELKNIIDE